MKLCTKYITGYSGFTVLYTRQFVTGGKKLVIALLKKQKRIHLNHIGWHKNRDE
tara:strand:- start:310 stop:471 length:162 start_codon:yes stop_codon:yes gene_type:complete